MSYWLDYEQGKDASESPRAYEYLWNAMNRWENCPGCGKLCGVVFPDGSQSVLLDPDTKRYVGQKGPQIRAQEHRCGDKR